MPAASPKPEKLPSIDGRGQTDRVTTPASAELLRPCLWPRLRHAARLAVLARS